MAGKAVEITSECFQVGGSGLTAPDDAAIFLLDLDGHAALIDAGCGRAQDLLLANIESVGVDPDRIELLLMTHCHYDHAGGAAGLRQRLGCSVVMHELDTPFLERGDDEVTAAQWYGNTMRPCVVDRRLHGSGEDILLGDRIVSAVHIPGHSPGSMAYVAASDGHRILFAQDVHGPLHPSLLSNREDYLASLQRLIDLGADVLCEGHFGIHRGCPEVARFVRSFMN